MPQIPDPLLCPQCGGNEFELLESPTGSKSVLVECCAGCGFVFGAVVDHDPRETDTITDKFDKFEGREPGGWRVVSMKRGY